MTRTVFFELESERSCDTSNSHPRHLQETRTSTKISISTPIWALITDAVKFIGWIWDFEKYAFTPNEEKECKEAELIRLMTERGTEISSTQLEKLMSIVTWVAMGQRPVLSFSRFVSRIEREGKDCCPLGEGIIVLAKGRHAELTNSLLCFQLPNSPYSRNLE